MIAKHRPAALVLGLGACLVLWTAGGGCSNRPAEPTARPTFDGPSGDLAQTQVVATLDEPITPGKNAIWCASFTAAWKALQNDLAKEPVALEDDGPLVDALNQAADPRPTIPAEGLYVAAGWNDRGIVEKIRADVKKQFPSKAAPTFPGIVPDSFVAYAYLEANVPFAIPYFQNRKPLVFKSADGRQSEVHGFGIRKEDDYAYPQLRQQAEVIYQSWSEDHRLTEFVIDLDRNSRPNQIVVAVIEPGKSLAEMLASLEKKIAAYQAEQYAFREIGPNDVLLVPDMCWRLSHRFAEMEGKAFANKNLSGQRLDVAQQDIMFRLDRSGAELRSESKIYCLPEPTCYLVNRPFLVYMKQRGADAPYFVMWVDNAELLCPWSGKSKPAKRKPARQNKTTTDVAKRPATWAEPVEMEGVPNLHKVSGTFYRSAQPTVAGMKNLKEKLGIKTVVNLRSFHSDRDEIGQTGLGYERITMKTWHPEEKEGVRFLQIVTDPKRQPVLVHCQRGADRTGAMCALYRIAVQGWSEEEAIREMRDGGYGFHRIWSNLPAWIGSLDVGKIKGQAGMDEKRKEPQMDMDKRR